MSATVRILAVDDDAQRREGLVSMLAAREPEWEIAGAAGITAARERFAAGGRWQVVLVDDDCDGGALALLEEVHRQSPGTARFLFTEATDTQVLAKDGAGAHQCVARSASPDEVAAALRAAILGAAWIPNERIRAAVLRMRTFRSLPSVYLEAMRELNSPTASAERVGEIMARDLAMTAKLLQLANSAFFGLQRRVTTPADAVVMLGMATVKAVAMGIQLYADLDKVKPLYFSTDKLWRHCLSVGTRARRLAQHVTGDARLAEEAFTAGLFHDIGKLILSVQLDELYQRSVTLAEKRRVPIWEIETELFGSSHGEAGACLLGLWGLPQAVVEAVGWHHQPLRSTDTGFTALTAVHLADVTEHACRPEGGPEVAPSVSDAYLERIGATAQWSEWQEVLANASAAEGGTQVIVQAGRGAERAATTAVAPERAADVPVTTRLWLPWLAPGLVAAALAAGLWWMIRQP